MKRIQEFTLRGASQRGAAKVNVIWLIILVTLVIFALVFAFSANSEKADLQLRLDDATAKAKAAKEAEDATSKQISELSRAIGWYDRNAPIPVSAPDSIKATVEATKQTFSDAGASVTDLENLIPVIEQNYKARTKEVQQLKDTVATLTTEKNTDARALRAASAAKETQIASLSKQLEDAQQAASRTQSGLEAQIATLKSTASDLETTLKTARGEIDAEKHRSLNSTAEYKARFDAMSNKIAFLKEPEAPDGALLAVSKGAQIGWIDIGANQRVAAGMKFAVISGKLGSKAVKCMAEVSKTEPGRSEVMFTGVVDQFDPPVIGDRIYNPLLDPKGQRNAVLVGRFSVPSENEVRGLLANLGITVQPKIDNTTDYLIVGGEMYVDKDGTALEEPIQPSETAVYKDAEAKGVAITPLKDLRAYFKF
ncbi:MAG TPA: hypothetical protein VK843_11455 [Planctomycetota bacterium]|nr:hypothetical protein [Planctomycetota bacterium]